MTPPPAAGALRHVVFVCRHNANRSVFATALFNELAKGTGSTAASAGTHPADAVVPEVVQALGEVGIDVAGYKPRQLVPATAEHAQLLVTFGPKAELPAGLPAAVEVREWRAGSGHSQKGIEVFRELREEIRAKVTELLKEAGGPAATKP